MDIKRILQAFLWIALVVAALISAIVVNMQLTDADFGESASSLQAIVAALAIIAAAIFAVLKLQVFRELAPHLTVSQKVSHRSIGETYIHIDVATTLKNSSRVRIELEKGFFTLQHIAPMKDQEVENLYKQVFEDEESKDILWPILDEIQRIWDKKTLVIEPGESHQEVCEFIVERTVRSVLVYAYFYNPYSATPGGWHSTTIYDMSCYNSSGN